jgi:hypothetical protein
VRRSSFARRSPGGGRALDQPVPLHLVDDLQRRLLGHTQALGELGQPQPAAASARITKPYDGRISS